MRRYPGATVGGANRPIRSVERGQSEVIGVVLLTAVVVILVSTAGFFLVTQFTDEDEQPRVNVQGEVTNGIGGTNGTIVLNHQGGDELDPGEISVFLQGIDAGDFVLAENFTERSGNNRTFARGDRWELEDGALERPLAGRFTLLVVHEPSDTALHREPYDI